jgi:putative FmdB family regulatory protein
MPLFEYTCGDCGHSFEELIFSNDIKVSCPQCDSEKIDKQLSTFGVADNSVTPCSGGSCPVPSGEAPPCSQGGCPGCV